MVDDRQLSAAQAQAHNNDFEALIFKFRFLTKLAVIGSQEEEVYAAGGGGWKRARESVTYENCRRRRLEFGRWSARTA